MFKNFISLQGNLVANLAQDQKEKDLKQQQQQQPQQNQQLQMHQQESNAAVVDIGKQQLDDSFPFHGNQIVDSAAKQPQQPMVDKQPLQQEAHLQGQGVPGLQPLDQQQAEEQPQQQQRPVMQVAQPGRWLTVNQLIVMCYYRCLHLCANCTVIVPLVYQF